MWDSHTEGSMRFCCQCEVLLIILIHKISFFPTTPWERQTASPFPYDLSSLQEVLHTICPQGEVPTSCPGHPVYTQSTDGRLSWSETLQNASVTLTRTHGRIGSHFSHKSETSCPTPALLQTETAALSGGWCSDLIMWPYSSHCVKSPVIDDLIMHTSQSVSHPVIVIYDSNPNLKSERTVHERILLYLRNKS